MTSFQKVLEVMNHSIQAIRRSIRSRLHRSDVRITDARITIPLLLRVIKERDLASSREDEALGFPAPRLRIARAAGERGRDMRASAAG